MKYSLQLLIICTALMLPSCSNVYTWSDTPSGINYNDFSTYMVDDQCSDYNPGVNPINQQRIKNAIELELRKLGYTRTENADINVKFYVKNETKYFYENCINEYNNYNNGEVCIEKAYSYEAGTLVVDLFNTKENKPIWHGGTSGNSWEKMKDPTSKINRAIKAMFKDFQTTEITSGYAGVTN